MMKRATLICGAFLTAACADSGDAANPAPTEPSAELRALGVTELSIEETATQLSIAGLDDQGQTIASLDLVLGRFTMTVDDRGEVDGRRMDITVAARTTKHESEGYASLTLPFPRDVELGVFLVDPAVASVLSRWGIAVEARPAGLELQPVEQVGEGETPYAYDCYDSMLQRIYSGGSGCVESSYGGCSSYFHYRYDGSTGPREFRCCSTTFNDRACTESGVSGWTPCGTAGNGGCAVCWSTPLSSSDNYCRISGFGAQCFAEFCN